MNLAVSRFDLISKILIKLQADIILLWKLD